MAVAKPALPANMKGYVTVAERLEAFYDKYPFGSIQSEIISSGINESKKEFVLFKAYAYRYPDDPTPGIGHAHEVNDGNSYINKQSMIENGETSAWGRALAALGFEVKEGVASQEEVDAAKRREKSGGGNGVMRAEDFKEASEARDAQMAVFKQIENLLVELGVSKASDKKALMAEAGLEKPVRDLTVEDLNTFVEFLTAKITEAESDGEESVTEDSE